MYFGNILTEKFSTNSNITCAAKSGVVLYLNSSDLRFSD